MKFNCAHDELLPIHKLTPNPKNPNQHPTHQIDRLAKIIDFQGQRHPVIVSKRSGFVVAGHGRLEALKKLGWTEVAVNYQEFENEAQEYAFIVSDNAIADWSELDLSQVNGETMDLGPDFDIDLLGIKDFLIDLADKEVDEKPEEESPEKLKFIICPHCEEKFEQGQALTIRDGFKSVIDE